MPQAEQMVSANKLYAPYYIRKLSFITILSLLFMSMPAAAGFLLNAALFYSLKMFVKRKTKGTVFYDSVLFGSLMIAYPLYYAAVNIVVWNLTSDWIIRMLTTLLPLFAGIAIRYKLLLVGVFNQMKLARAQKEMPVQLY